MMMVLSYCDLLAVSTNHPLSALMAMLWLTGKLGTYESWVDIFGFFSKYVPHFFFAPSSDHKF
jgi:hypothetical protein